MPRGRREMYYWQFQEDDLNAFGFKISGCVGCYRNVQASFGGVVDGG